jgi:hypothetical protein
MATRTLRPVDLRQALKESIHQQAWGRIRKLHIMMMDGRVIVHGVAPSFYLKQRAIAGAQDALAAANVGEIELDVRIVVAREARGNGTASD